MRELFFLLIVGCGAVAEEPETETPEDPMSEEPAAAPTERMVPLCAGDDGWQAGECQRLVYGDTGYCNRWVVCP